MVQLDTLRAVNERLKPFCRLMGDLQLATELLGSVDGEIDDHIATIEQLKTQIQAKNSELAQLNDRVRESVERHIVDIAALDSSKAHAKAELTLFKQNLEREQQSLQEEADQKRHAVWLEFDSYTKSLQEKQQTIVAEYEKLCVARDALKSQVKDLL